jgi:tetratricopeptide (TPR) repeat protein
VDTFQRARQLYLEGHIHDALEAAQSACERRPKDAEAWWLLGCVSRHAGLLQASDSAFEWASRLSGDRSPPVRVAEERFGRLLEEVLAGLPDELRKRLDGLTLRSEPVPAEEMMESGVRPDALSTRAPEDLLVLYQVNLENRSPDEEALAHLLREVLLEA